MAKLIDLIKKLDRMAATTFDIAAQTAASNVVQDLRRLGPWWSGEFAKNWEIRIDEDIPADRRPSDESPWGYQEYEDILARQTSRAELPRIIPPDVTGRQALQKGRYVIGNRMSYRDIAQDLIPGRIKVEGGGTADQDWYTTYVFGGALNESIKLSVVPVLQKEGFR